MLAIFGDEIGLPALYVLAESYAALSNTATSHVMLAIQRLQSYIVQHVLVDCWWERRIRRCYLVTYFASLRHAKLTTLTRLRGNGRSNLVLSSYE